MGNENKEEHKDKSDKHGVWLFVGSQVLYDKLLYMPILQVAHSNSGNSMCIGDTGATRIAVSDMKYVCNYEYDVQM